MLQPCNQTPTERLVYCLALTLHVCLQTYNIVHKMSQGHHHGSHDPQTLHMSPQDGSHDAQTQGMDHMILYIPQDESHEI